MNGAQPGRVAGGGAGGAVEARVPDAATFEEQLPLIEKVAKWRARRAGFAPEEVEDFISEVKLKIMAEDYRVLRQHRGKSSLSTYLTTVVNNRFLDYCNQKFGKFRPSAKVKRLGKTALALERLIVCERHDSETAVAILDQRPDIEETREELQQLAEEVPTRVPRREVSDDVLENHPSSSPDASAEKRVEDEERRDAALRIEEVLNTALAAVSAQDLLILRMHLRDRWKISAIARTLRLDQRSLYSRKEKCYAQLRRTFSEQGVTWQEVCRALEWDAVEFRTILGDHSGESPAGPSNEETEEQR